MSFTVVKFANYYVFVEMRRTHRFENWRVHPSIPSSNRFYSLPGSWIGSVREPFAFAESSPTKARKPAVIRSLWIAALCTFTAFLICGLAPLAPYLFGTEHSLRLSVLLTGIVFFVIGSVKSRWSTSSWWHSGLTTLAVGAIAASIAYFTGVGIKRLLG